MNPNPIRPIEVIQLEVGKWSYDNFGLNISAVNRVELGSLCSLMGMVEEIGELTEASTFEETKDALADIGIYLCDFAYREGVTLKNEDIFYRGNLLGTDYQLFRIMGRLYHCVLKRHQGIDKYNPNTTKGQATYSVEKDKHCKDIVRCLHLIGKRAGIDFLATLNEVWDKVKQRNWKSNPITGGDKEKELAMNPVYGSIIENPPDAIEPESFGNEDAYHDSGL